MAFRRNSIDVREAAKRVAEGATLVDVRRKDEVKQGMAAGAVHIPQGRLDSAARRFQGKQVLVICRSGNRSSRAAATLRGQGIDALNVRGGMLAWSRHDLPVASANRNRRK